MAPPRANQIMLYMTLVIPTGRLAVEKMWHAIETSKERKRSHTIGTRLNIKEIHDIINNVHKNQAP